MLNGKDNETDLLSRPLIRILRSDGQHAIVNLPDLYALLMADRIAAVTALRPHQKHALHAFLVQVGALALLKAGRDAVPREGDEWRDLLRGLTPDFPDNEPWSLVVHDLSRPALLQPPVPEGKWAALKEVEATPDGLDMLVTSKNHDLKGRRMVDAAPDAWFFSLLTLQTMEGFLGAGNYGISRMNGGFASRAAVGVAPHGGWGARVRRDILRLLAIREEQIVASAYFMPHDGIGLVWLEPWDGTASLQPSQLDPYYVEICRRIRLREVNGALVAHRGSSKVARIAFPKENKGVTGDPWSPIDREESKALTVDGAGFHYRRVTDLLDAKTFRPAPLQDVTVTDGTQNLRLLFAATARGQGETNGHHERIISDPAESRRPACAQWWRPAG